MALRIAAAAWVVVSALVLVVTPARAQGNMNAAPIGGRSTLMGGTGIALGRDGAAPFLNPATLVRIGETGVAFSASFYAFRVTTLRNFHQPGPVDESRYGPMQLPNADFTRSRVEGIPVTLCFFVTTQRAKSDAERKGRSKFALCFGNVERSSFDATGLSYSGDSAGTHTTETVSIARSWNRLRLGPSFAIYVSDRLALGVSLQAIVTTMTSTWSLSTLATNTTSGLSDSSYDTSLRGYSADVGGLLGLIYSVGPKEILGLNVWTPSARILGRYDATASIAQLAPSSYSLLSTASGSFYAPTPLGIGVGAGSERERLHVEGDATMWIPIGPFMRTAASGTQTTYQNGAVTTQTLDASMRVPGNTVVNGSFGLEYFVHPTLSVVGGVSTDWSVLAPLPQNPPIGTLAESRTHRVATSLGFGTYGRGGSELLLGTQLSYGWGRAVAVDPYVEPPRLALVAQRTFQVMLIVAGQTSLATLRSTFERIVLGR